MKLVDTDVIVDVLREYPPAMQWLTTTPVTELGLPGIVLLELIEGCANLHEVRRTQRLLRPYPIFWPTTADCERALAAFARYNLRHNLGLEDALMGECAVGLGVPLITFNVQHFRAVPNLVTEQPYGRV